MLLRDAITIPTHVSASDFVLQLEAGVQQAQTTVEEYAVTASLAEAFEKALASVSSAVESGADKGSFIHGSFGTGKSHFMAVLHLLLAGNTSALALQGLQHVVAEYASTLATPMLKLDFHLIGAASLEDAIFGGYLKQVARLHPDATPPVLHVSDALFIDAQSMRTTVGDDAFFAGLNAGASTDWGVFSGGWDAASFEAAVAAPQSDTARSRLASALTSSYFTSYALAGEWLGVDAGFGVIAEHAKSLGYQAVVLFLDELVLWLASHLADSEFVGTEGAKVAKLVESGFGVRAVPLVSFVARQRDLKDFLGDSVPGAERVAVGQAFAWWEGRFDTIELKASDLPAIVHQRLLLPSSPEGEAALATALADVKRNRRAWDALLADEGGADEAAFAKVYPFSPALVDTLIALSGLLQRERTALKVMAQLLVQGRDHLKVTDVIPVGDLYDVMVEGGDQPLTDDMKTHFAIARDLYRSKLRPMLLADHGLTETAVAGSRPGAIAEGAPAAVASFFTDDRLVKTLLIAALAPGAASLRNLNASRLAYLNYGAVAAPIPGTEVNAVLIKVKSWAQQIGELQVGDGNDPIVRLELSGVDYDSVLERVRAEDTMGARRTLLRKLVFEQMGINAADSLLAETPYASVWRGSKRTLDVVFGNVRNHNELPDASLQAQGDKWKLIVDYPFDPDDHGPNDDRARIDNLRQAGVTSRMVAWIPFFLTDARLDDVGTLVLLEHLLAGAGDKFSQHSAHLPTDSRAAARAMLDNRRKNLRDSLGGVIKQAYGVARVDGKDIDTSYGDFAPYATLDAGLSLQPLVGATLEDALGGLVDQMLSSQFPEHPRFEPGHSEVHRRELAVVLDHVSRAVVSGGRVDSVERDKRGTLSRVGNALKVGETYENHYVFQAASFPWRNIFTAKAAAENLSTIPMTRVREWLAPYGMARDVENLLVCAWALLDDKQWSKSGATVTVTSVEQVTDDLDLREATLPDETDWVAAVDRAAALFGSTVSNLRSAANVALLATSVRAKAQTLQAPASDLLAELETHAKTLGLDEQAPRMASARFGRDLVAKLAVEGDDVMLIDALAMAPLPAEVQPLARSLSSAAVVSAALRGLMWTMLTGIAEIVDTDPRYPRAQLALETLAETARANELHKALGPALGASMSEAASILAVAPPVEPPVVPPVVPVLPPVLPPETAKQVDDISLDDIDDRFDEMREEARKALKSNSALRLHVKWWSE